MTILFIILTTIFIHFKTYNHAIKITSQSIFPRRYHCHFCYIPRLVLNSLSNEVPKRTHEENLTPQVIAGKHIWEKNNCMGCHTILGEGAYYAPELTKVYERRGEAYIKAALMSKTPWAPRGRQMVAYALSEQEANDVVAF